MSGRADGRPAGRPCVLGKPQLRSKAVPRPHFHLPNALGQQRLGQGARPFQEGILIRILRRVDARVVDRNRVAAAAAHQVVERLTQVLAHEVPQGDVQGRKGPHLRAGVAKEIRVGEEALPVAFTVERRLPEEERRRVVVDDRFHGARHMVGLAQAGETFRAVDLHPHRVRMLGEPQGLDLRDLHGVS